MTLNQAIIATTGWLIALVGGLGWDGKIPGLDQPAVTLTLIALGMGAMLLTVFLAAQRSLRTNTTAATNNHTKSGLGTLS